MKTTKPIPPVIQKFIEASNSGDRKAYLDCFTDDALVNDIQREFRGKRTIKRWSDEELFKVYVTMKVVKVTHHHGDTFLKAKIDGNYDKKAAPDPLFLDFYFFLTGRKIATLMIIRDSVKSAQPSKANR